MVTEVFNVDYEYSEEWDTLLNKILCTYEKASFCKSGHTLDFKVKVSEETTGWFIKKKVTTYKTYEVWISNPSCRFGFLYSIDNSRLPDIVRKSAKQSTLNKLRDKVKSLPYE